MLYMLATDLCKEKLEIRNYFHKFKGQSQEPLD